MIHTHRLVVVVLAIGLAGCKPSASQEPATTAAPNFELACKSSNTATAAELFCIRTDTRSGDVVRVKHLSLPTSNGPTGTGAAGRPGLFTTACEPTSTDTRSDLYCIRLNTETGEMLLVNLQKVGVIPDSK